MKAGYGRYLCAAFFVEKILASIKKEVLTSLTIDKRQTYSDFKTITFAKKTSFPF